MRLLSNELQIGKAGQHLVCCDLILQGFSAFPADEGSPYDVLVDVEGQIIKMQVKSSMKPSTCGKTRHKYNYGTRRAKKSRKRTDIDTVDVFAFVALDKRVIAYLPVKDMLSKDGKALKQLIQFKTRDFDYSSERYKNGIKRGRYIEDFGMFGDIIT